ncbi:unnamed protein product [Amoebophrya sp. A25]|nr:unnamed protein product [Amoebophrya sp. A25]|eukprot:GSA25T00008337001.1
MMNGTGGEGDSVRSVADKRKQEQDALRRDYFNTLVKNSLQQQTGAAQQASSGTSSLTAASSSSSTTAGNYKPPTGPLAISDYGLSRLSVKEQFEALLRSYGDAALPANFHHIFWHRLPPATRRYLSNVDTIFGSLIQKNPSSPRKLPGASGFAAAEGTSDIVLVDAQSTSPTGQNGEPEVLNDEKLALEYCISRYCFLAGVQIPRNSSEHYANWVVKSEFLGLVGPERLARDSLILMFMINKTKRYAPLHSWKNTLLDMCDPEMVARVERETLGAYDQDAQSGRLGRLRFYDHADEHMDPFVVERYLNSGTFERAKDEVVRNVKALKAMKSNQLELQRLEVQLLSAREGATEQQKEHLQTVREQCVQKAAASGVPEMQARNLLSSSTTEQRVLRKLLFYLRVILAERAHAEDELLRKLQTGFPTTQITAQMLEKALMEPIDCTTNCMLLATATAHQAQIKPGSGGGATTSNGKSTSARTRDLQIDDDEDEDEFEASPRNVNRRYYWKNVIGYAQCLTISDHQMAELQRIQTHCASVYDNTFRLHRQCKKVYYWKKFGTSLGLALAGSTSTSNSFNSTSTSSTSQANNYLCLLGNEHSDIRRVILDFFAQRGAGTRDEILAEVQHRVPDVERRQLTFYALRKIISEFAVYRHDRYIFLGFVGSQLHAAGAGGGR